MLMPGVRIDAAAGLILDGQVDLVRALQRHLVPGRQCSVVLDHHPLLVPMLDVDLAPIEVVSMFLKDEPLRSLLDDCLDG